MKLKIIMTIVALLFAVGVLALSSSDIKTSPSIEDKQEIKPHIFIQDNNIEPVNYNGFFEAERIRGLEIIENNYQAELNNMGLIDTWPLE